MLLGYKYRIEPNATQAAALDEMLGSFCQLYNAALEHRIAAYRKGSSVSCYDQNRALPIIRRDMPEHGRWSSAAQQQVLRRLEKAFKFFFARVKRNEKPGFPRFRPKSRYSSADFRVGDGLTIRKSNRLGFVGIPGEVKVRWHRPLPSKAKAAVLTRRNGKWHVTFYVEVAIVERASQDSVGIDLGLTSLVTLSNGEAVARPNWTKSTAKAFRRHQRAIARCKRGSKNRRKRVAAFAKHHSRSASQRRDFCHKLSRDLVNRFGRIAVENLNIKGLAAGKLAKHVNDAAWAQIISMLEYKATNAGVQVVKVDPRGTSQTCPECMAVAAKTLSTREHRCGCGCAMDRDVAAAQIVHLRAFGFVPGTGIGELSQRSAAQLSPGALSLKIGAVHTVAFEHKLFGSA